MCYIQSVSEYFAYSGFYDIYLCIYEKHFFVIIRYKANLYMYNWNCNKYVNLHFWEIKNIYELYWR